MVVNVTHDFCFRLLLLPPSLPPLRPRDDVFLDAIFVRICELFVERLFLGFIFMHLVIGGKKLDGRRR